MPNFRRRQPRHFESLEQRNLLSGTPSLLLDVHPGRASSWPTEFVDVDGTTFFAAADRVAGKGLWKSDGTEAGTELVSVVDNLDDGTGLLDPQSLTAVDGTLFFSAFDFIDGHLAHGTELWKSDGTEAGTVLVKNIRPGGGCTGFCPIVGSPPLSSSPKMLRDLNRTLMFTAFREPVVPSDSFIGTEIWKSDGTEEGTVLVKNIRSNGSSNPRSLVIINDKFFFVANDGVHGPELWTSDGTEDGTMLVRDITEGAGSDRQPVFLSTLGDMLYFAQRIDNSGVAPWKSDGTEEGTTRVHLVGPDGVERNLLSQLVPADDGKAFFIARRAAFPDPPAELWVMDVASGEGVFLKTLPGNPSLGGERPGNLTAVGGNIYLTVYDESRSGIELWMSDGTSEGTGLVSDIVPGIGGSHPTSLTSVNGSLYFTADDGIHGRELWRSDGTEEGTVLVEDIKLGPEGSEPQELKAIDGTLYFSADDGVHGREPWTLMGETGSITGDIDGNGEVDFGDFLILAQHFGSEVTPNTNGDIDGDGSVQFADFLLLSENFARTTSAPAAALPSTESTVRHDPTSDGVDEVFAESDSVSSLAADAWTVLADAIQRTAPILALLLFVVYSSQLRAAEFRGLGAFLEGDGFFSEAIGLSDDGSTIVGNSIRRYKRCTAILCGFPGPPPVLDTDTAAFRWTASTGIQDVVEFQFGSESRVTNISPDGSFILGSKDDGQNGVDFSDFLILSDNFGQTAGGDAAQGQRAL